MTDLQKEIRQILLGYITYHGEKIAAGKGVFDRSFGTFNGNGSARILGVTEIKKKYMFPDAEGNMKELCKEAFLRLGREVDLLNARDKDAVLLTPIFYNPSVLTCEFTEDGVILTVCTARTATVYINAAHAFRAWEKRMPEKLQSEMIPKEKKEDPKKQEKKEKRKEKRKNRKKGLFKRAADSGTEKGINEAASQNEAAVKERTSEEKKAGGPRHGK